MKRDLAAFVLLVAVAAAIWYARRPVPVGHKRTETYPRTVEHSPVESSTEHVTHKRAEPRLEMSDNFSAEFVYRNIELHGWRLSYTYAARVYVSGPNDFKQRAHYSHADLRTVHAELTDKEAADLGALVKQSGFLGLKKEVYGGRGRYYPYTLSVRLDNKRRQVSYQSSPNAGPCPKAFRTVEDALIGLVERKFHTKCD